MSATQQLLATLVPAAGGGTVVTWNPSDKGASVTLSGSNLIATGGATAYTTNSVRATAGKSSGKHYFEARLNSTTASNYQMVGICASTASLSGFYLDSSGYAYYEQTGLKYHTGTGSAYGAAYAAGDVIGVAFDASAGTIEFFKNNVSQGVAYTGIAAGTYYPALAFYTTAQFTGRFKTADFSYTPPTGYAAWGI